MQENEILTPEEKAALQASADVDTHASTDAGAAFKVVDFSQLQNSTAHYPGLQPILELFILDSAQQFIRFFHRKLSVQLAHFQFDSFGQYCHKITNSGFYNLLFIKSHQMYGLVCMPYEFLDYALNALYGGRYDAQALPFKGLGKIGLKVVNRLLKMILTTQQQVFNEITRMDFEIVKTIVNPGIITKIGRNEMLSITRYHVQFSELTTWFDILMPRSILDQLKPQLQKSYHQKNDPEESLWQLSLKQEILNAKVTVIAKLPNVTMTLKNVLELKAGDILPISDPRTIDICSGDKKLYYGLAGVQDTKRVVKIHGNY